MMVIDEQRLAINQNLNVIFGLYCCGCGVVAQSDEGDREMAIIDLHVQGWRARGEHSYCPKCGPEFGF